MNRSLQLIVASAVALVAAGCTEPEPDYCEADRPGCFCDVVRARCIAAPLDAAVVVVMDQAMVGDVGVAADLGATPDLATPKPECALNRECASGLCRDQKCVRSADIYYVDNRGVKVADCRLASPMADGNSPKRAFCDISDAVAQPSRAFVLVASSAELYGRVTISGNNGGSVSIVASERLGATIGPQPDVGQASVVVSGKAGRVAVLLDGVRVGGSALSPAAIDCVGKPGEVSLTVEGAFIVGGGTASVHASDCTIAILDSTLQEARTGLVIEGVSAYRVLNSALHDFALAGQGPAVQLGPGATGAFSFNTVVNNGKGNLAGGVQCLGNQLLESSIVFANSMLNSSQLSGCRLLNVVTGPDSAPGAELVTPAFTNCTSSLAAGQTWCTAPNSPVVDRVPLQADGGARTLVDHDYFGNRRPLGAGYDVGAQEVR